MKDFFKDLGRWFDDPMTQAMIAALGALIVLNGIESAHQRIRVMNCRLKAVDSRVEAVNSRMTALERSRNAA